MVNRDSMTDNKDNSMDNGNREEKHQPGELIVWICYY